MDTNYLIILINYDNWYDTVECIHSLINCCVKESNILIIENCSPNNSYEKLKENFPLIKILRMEKNLGFTGGNNVGIRYAFENNYEYAILLNNDTIIKSQDSILTLINEMVKNPDITLSTGRIFYYPDKDKIWYDGGKINKWRGLAVHNNYGKERNTVHLNNEKRCVDFISGCFMCIRLSDIQKLGYLDENFFMYLDDVEYSMRAVKKNLKLLYIPQVVIYHKAIGEGKRTNKMVYYSIRNRRLLINLHFGFITRLYFEIVLITKTIMWFFFNKKYYTILLQAIKDYNSKFFGQSPEHIE